MTGTPEVSKILSARLSVHVLTHVCICVHGKTYMRALPTFAPTASSALGWGLTPLSVPPSRASGSCRPWWDAGTRPTQVWARKPQVLHSAQGLDSVGPLSSRQSYPVSTSAPTIPSDMPLSATCLQLVQTLPPSKPLVLSCPFSMATVASPV